jgi:hypothetical protein
MNFMTMNMAPPDPHPGVVESDPGGPGDDEEGLLPALMAAPVQSIWDVMYDETGIPRDRGAELEAEIQNAYCEVLDYEHGLVDRPSAMKTLLREITSPMELIVAGFIMAMAEQRFMEYAIRAKRHADANRRLEQKKAGHPPGYG